MGGTPDAATEKQLVVLLSQPLEQYGVVTTLALESYALVLALLRPAAQKVRSITCHDAALPMRYPFVTLPVAASATAANAAGHLSARALHCVQAELQRKRLA